MNSKIFMEQSSIESSPRCWKKCITYQSKVCIMVIANDAENNIALSSVMSTLTYSKWILIWRETGTIMHVQCTQVQQTQELKHTQKFTRAHTNTYKHHPTNTHVRTYVRTQAGTVLISYVHRQVYAYIHNYTHTHARAAKSRQSIAHPMDSCIRPSIHLSIHICSIWNGIWQSEAHAHSATTPKGETSESARVLVCVREKRRNKKNWITLTVRTREYRFLSLDFISHAHSCSMYHGKWIHCRKKSMCKSTNADTPAQQIENNAEKMREIAHNWILFGRKQCVTTHWQQNYQQRPINDWFTLSLNKWKRTMA